jgi:hypothetical protein
MDRWMCQTQIYERGISNGIERAKNNLRLREKESERERERKRKRERDRCWPL